MFIELQVCLIKKYCQDDNYDIIVIDNSNISSCENEIRRICENLQVEYHKVDSKKIKDPSRSHGFALNYGFVKFKNDYDCMFFLDHDLFPTMPFSVAKILGFDTDNRLIAAGLVQGSSIQFFWAGCFILNLKDVDSALLGDFSPNSGIGMDTNSHSSNLLKVYDKKSFYYFDEQFIINDHLIEAIRNKNQNEEISGDDAHKEYQLINNGMFFHFRSGSNWTGSVYFGERIGSLFSKLNEKLL